MKLFTIYSQSHRRLFDEWFAPSLWADASLEAHFISSCTGGFYRSMQWQTAIMHKLELILNMATTNLGETMIFADVDIQFFRNPIALLCSALEHQDIVFQAESPFNNCCTGFFAMRCTPSTTRLWHNIFEIVVKSNGKLHDQDALNLILAKSALCFECRIGILPSIFLGGGTLTGQPWEPGVDLNVPEDIVLHHANFTKGIANKIQQLELVRTKYQLMRSSISR